MIVMFHYVTDESNTSADCFHPRYYCSRDKLISLTKRFLRQNKKFVTYREYSEIISVDPSAENKLICFTFDDATIDHFEVVAPTLADFRVTASFYPITKVLDLGGSCALPIHQYQIASSLIQCERTFSEHLSRLVELEFGIQKINLWRKKFSGWAGLDDQDVLLVKRILEVELSESQSQKFIHTVLDSMSSSISSKFERIIQKFYCGKHELKEMYNAGFEVGSHSHTHRWLGQIPEDDAVSDIHHSIDILRKIDVLAQKWTVCYPHGNWSVGLLEKLKMSSDCIGGLVMGDLAPGPDLEYLTSRRLDISAL